MAMKAILPAWIRSLASRAYLRARDGARIGRASRVDLSTRFEGNNVVGESCRIGRCTLGYGTYVSDGTTATGVRFGRYCSCGANSTFALGRHPVRGFISTHPAFFSTRRQAGFTFVSEDRFDEFRFADRERGDLVTVGNDVWIGSNVLVMDGVTIGDGAVVGAGAVVTRDVEPYAVVAGVPARTVGHRFDPPTIEALMQAKWWQREPTFLKQHARLFSDVDGFLQMLADNDRAR